MQASVPLWVYLLSVVLGPAVGGIIALLGAFGAPWIKARTDLDQWRREKRLDAYAELARITWELQKVTLDVLKPGGGRNMKTQLRFDQTAWELFRAASRVSLLSPREVSKTAIDLSDHVMSSGVFLARGPASVFGSFIAGLESTYQAFMDAARRDLGTQ